MLSEVVNDYFEPVVVTEPSDIVLAAGGSFALSALIEQILNPGDGVLVAAPYWPGLDLCFSVQNDSVVLPVHIPLDIFFQATSVRFYEDALRDAPVAVKAVLICNPHNPLGQCYPRESLEAILAFCKSHGLHYISNEVYALSRHQDPSAQCASPDFVSILSLEAQADYVHVIYSLSKDFGCNGIRLVSSQAETLTHKKMTLPQGGLITKNVPIRLSAALNTHSQVSSMSAWIATRYILSKENLATVKREMQRELKEAYLFTEKFLLRRNIAFFPAAYGQFIFAKLLTSERLGHMDEFSHALQRHGVAISSGLSYHFQEPGWFRICYAVPRPILEEGLARIDRSLKS